MTAKIKSPRKIRSFEPGTRKGKFTYGENVIIGDAVIDLCGDVTLGDYVTIYGGVRIFTHKHFQWKHSRKIRRSVNKKQPVNLVIGRDVFIGYDAVILAIESIGEGAIIGARAVVTKNVPPFEIWAGNPAKRIGIREDK